MIFLQKDDLFLRIKLYLKNKETYIKLMSLKLGNKQYIHTYRRKSDGIGGFMMFLPQG